MKQSIDELFENEWYMVRHSGESPEIAYHSAIYFLSRAKDGPGLQLHHEQLAWLKKGATDRFREIILRDLHHCNAEKSMYRGIMRSIVNYQRFTKFCSRQDIEDTTIRQETAQALLTFVNIERGELAKKERATIINCSAEDLLVFAQELGVKIGHREDILRLYCP